VAYLIRRYVEITHSSSQIKACTLFQYRQGFCGHFKKVQVLLERFELNPEIKFVLQAHAKAFRFFNQSLLLLWGSRQK